MTAPTRLHHTHETALILAVRREDHAVTADTDRAVVVSLIRRKLVFRDGDRTHLTRRGVLAAARCADIRAAGRLPVGAVVVYDGTITGERGEEYEVVAVDDKGRMRIRHTIYRSVGLKQVRRESVRDTGRRRPHNPYEED